MKKVKVIFIIVAVIVLIFININVSYGAGVFDQGKNFIKKGEENATVDKQKLNDSTSFLYNTLVGIGTAAAVIVGMVLGIKYMVGSVEEKAETKGILIGYVCSCTVILVAYVIWKITISILSGV